MNGWQDQSTCCCPIATTHSVIIVSWKLLMSCSAHGPGRCLRRAACAGCAASCLSLMRTHADMCGARVIEEGFELVTEKLQCNGLSASEPS